MILYKVINIAAVGAVNGHRHKAACLVQEAMSTIVSNNEQRLKSAATIIAKNMTTKVT